MEHEQTTMPAMPQATISNIVELTAVIQQLIDNQTQCQATMNAQATRIQELEAALQTALNTIANTPAAASARPPTVAPAIRDSDFKMPSVKPIQFSGNLKHKPAHELQNLLDDYLERSLELCKLYNFAPDYLSVTRNGQPTYVQFATAGLADQARIAWRRVPEDQRSHMNWDEYSQWIHKTFGSTLTLSQAIEAMERLSQTQSALVYSAAFNELVSAIEAAGIKYPDKHLCIKYLNGLKPHLQTVPELYHITDDLAKLQQEAEKLDDIQFRRARRFRPPAVTQTYKGSPKPNGNKTTYNHGNSRLGNSFPNADGPTPMELGNTTAHTPFRRLTPDEKAHYRAKGWCVYCQDKRHDVTHCPELQSRRNESNNFSDKSKEKFFKGINHATQVSDDSVYDSAASKA
jgi:hypothetical protein